jgi:putative SOS response-associated peptidase YedK
MPVILPPSLFDEWLAPSPIEDSRLNDLLVPHSAEAMEVFPVSTYVNSPANDGVDCLQRVDNWLENPRTR